MVDAFSNRRRERHGGAARFSDRRSPHRFRI